MTHILLIVFAVAVAECLLFGIGIYSFIVADEVLLLIVSIELTTRYMSIGRQGREEKH
jgi:small neutral amino acid transporter SnatA (MarC family)